jgi:TonB family protein
MSNTLKNAAMLLSLAALAAGVVAPRPASADDQEAARKVTKKVAPVFPEIARQARLSGTVKLMLTVTPEGAVKSVKTVGGNAVFVPAAEEAVKKWKYEAAKKESTESVAVNFAPPQ